MLTIKEYKTFKLCKSNIGFMANWSNDQWVR